MGFFERKIQAAVSKALLKSIQATEGQKAEIALASLMEESRASRTIPGLVNQYKTYDGQVTEMYKKYNGEQDYGCQQTRAVLDIRSAFVAGEGLSISVDNKLKAHKDFFNRVLDDNKLKGSLFFRIVKGTELTGKALLKIDKGKLGANRDENDIPSPRILYFPYKQYKYTVDVTNNVDGYSVSNVKYKNNGKDSEIKGDMIYIRTGGDDCDMNKTTTKTGLVLTDIENYDRAMKDIRANNYYHGKLTPHFTTKSKNETDALAHAIKTGAWKIGNVSIGTHDMKIVSPDSGALECFKIELSTAIKTISAVTGVLVHWLGWVDLMSNRSTAETLYDFVNTHTITERTILAEAFKELLIKVQEKYINDGGKMIATVLYDFEVSIPILDFSRFLDMIRGLSMALNDGIITEKEYRTYIPGLSPIQEDEEKENQEDATAEKYRSVLDDAKRELAERTGTEKTPVGNGN